ncbi:short chain dehydrogenase [Salinisphaera sp. PC39]|uniref:SDR family NAD(P)-dependent oxidoreductase n=1 Tax=Salinisphaera sp. PC39 TaxID=1304156 RepID=UPI00333FE4D8
MNTVLVTGAASGLGWVLARRFFDRGDRVLLADLDADGLARRAAELAAEDAARVAHRALDLTDGDARQALADWIERDIGGLDLLVNNAGITHRSLAADTDPAVLRRVMAVDWDAPVSLTLALLPLLRARRGGLINIGSMAGWMPVLGRAGYCSAKAAFGQFFEVLRGEVAADGIHILMVYPSFLATPIETNALGADGTPAAHARSTTGAMRTPEWMADRILRGWDRGERRIHGDAVSRFGSLLWRLAPDLYQRLMTRRFASELSK